MTLTIIKQGMETRSRPTLRLRVPFLVPTEALKYLHRNPLLRPKYTFDYIGSLGKFTYAPLHANPKP